MLIIWIQLQRAAGGSHSRSPAENLQLSWGRRVGVGYGGLRNLQLKSEAALKLFLLLQQEGSIFGNNEWLFTVIKYRSLCVAGIVCKPKSKECCGWRNREKLCTQLCPIVALGSGAGGLVQGCSPLACSLPCGSRPALGICK